MASAPLAPNGNATISRIFSSSFKSIKIRSIPGAIPACGGAPYLNASYNYGNFDSTTDSSYPTISNALFNISRLWFLTPPDAIS